MIHKGFMIPTDFWMLFVKKAIRVHRSGHNILVAYRLNHCFRKEFLVVAFGVLLIASLFLKT